ncbi:MAG TPA: RtcB family protein [Rubrobacter sp.]|nr:RtcB family protein [Rubrobacter sp.]
MVSGKDLIERGWPQGRAIGLALDAAERLRSVGMDDDAILRELEKVRAAPDSVPDLEPLARELASKPEADAAALEDALREEPRPYGVWGADLIEAGTTAQMEDAMRLPVSVGGALMPDAHLGYGLPVGGVLATEGAVIPWAVGVDIACRMRLSVFGVDPALLDERRTDLANVLLRNTNFGAGSKYKEGRRLEHEVLEDPAWEVTSFLKGLKDTGRAQLGTSGSGNHFVEWGVFEALGEVGDALTQPEEGVRQEGAEKAFETGRRYLALLSHSGSRGVGFKIANRYSKVAKEKHPKLEGSVADLAWLDLDNEEGGEYWLSMQLAGRFASANHAVIHDKIARALGEEAMTKVENHHNFAWRERVGEREAIVHRKGATPAGRGVMGVIPGSMGDPGYVVRGKGDERSLNSASHGAGRLMSRSAAFKSLSEERWRGYLAERGVTLIGGSLDEAPMAYKDIEAVVGLQGDLVDLVGRFTPKIVRMDAGGRPWGKKKRR